MRQGLIKKCKNWSIIVGAITATFVLFGIVYGSWVKPTIRTEAKTMIDSCKISFVNESIERDNKIETRVMKIECGLWTIMSVKEREKASELFKQIGGKR
jgi:hypothetical protein